MKKKNGRQHFENGRNCIKHTSYENRVYRPLNKIERQRGFPIQRFCVRPGRPVMESAAESVAARIKVEVANEPAVSVETVVSTAEWDI